jgi:hypothetical protein
MIPTSFFENPKKHEVDKCLDARQPIQHMLLEAPLAIQLCQLKEQRCWFILVTERKEVSPMISKFTSDLFSSSNFLS